MHLKDNYYCVTALITYKEIYKIYYKVGYYSDLKKNALLQNRMVDLRLMKQYFIRLINFSTCILLNTNIILSYIRNS